MTSPQWPGMSAGSAGMENPAQWPGGGVGHARMKALASKPLQSLALLPQ